MNRVSLVGRLAYDLELKKTQGGTDFVNFTVAIKKYGDGTDFIPCVAWNKQAEFLSSYAKKGNRVSVDGRLSQRQYENQDGKKVNVVEVIADQVELLESKPKEEPTFDVGKKLVVDVDNDLPF